jgi:hypothetical protein
MKGAPRGGVEFRLRDAAVEEGADGRSDGVSLCVDVLARVLMWSERRCDGRGQLLRSVKQGVGEGILKTPTRTKSANRTRPS